MAKDRREAKIKMEKLQIDQMVLEYKVNEFEKILKQKQRIAWLRMRAKIIVLARAISNYTRLVETLKDLDRNVDKRKEELNTIETEVSRDDFQDFQFSIWYIQFLQHLIFDFFLASHAIEETRGRKEGSSVETAGNATSKD